MAALRKIACAVKSSIKRCGINDRNNLLSYGNVSYRVLHSSSVYRKYAKFTSSHEAVLTQQGAKDFIFRLTVEEREVLLNELQAFQLAASKSDGTAIPPTNKQLRAVATHSALPFIGFGFLDNFIMIVAGDYIDATIGLTLGISTMAAAGLGNTLSDVAGIGSAWYVENMAIRIGVTPPSLTPTQVDMPRTRWSANIGRALGVTIGCLLGMVPLIFMSKKSTKDEKETEKR